MGGVSYRWDWMELLAVYRHIEYDQDANEMVQDLRFSGPAIAASFRF